MGVLDFLRGRKKKKKPLPLPTPVTPIKQPIKTDIPPIKPIVKKVDTVPKPPILEKPPILDIPKPIKKIDHLPAIVRKKEPQPLDQVHTTKDMKHIFVSSNEYASIIEKTNVIRSKLLASDDVISKLSQLQTVEQKELKKWQDQLEGLEKKLTYMETVLAKSGEV
jgi:uncharacterized coiled-coil protein SlyX